MYKNFRVEVLFEERIKTIKFFLLKEEFFRDIIKEIK
jgi:hypothetical protein